MKKLLTSMIAVALMLTLLLGAVSCGDDGETFTMNITGINGITDPVIDSTAKTVTFTVQNDRDAFPLSDIVFASDFELSYEAYADKDLTQKYEGASVPLKEGDNTFWVKGWVDGLPDAYDVYEFRVTRIASAPSAVSIDVVGWQTQYHLYEFLADLDLTITQSDGSTVSADLTASMLTGFDTSSEGEKLVVIAYNGMTVTKTITVSEPVLSDFEIGSFRTQYLQGDPLDLDGAYLDVDGRKIAVVEEMVSGFDTSTGGEKTVTIAYGGVSKTVAVTVTSTGPVIPPEEEELDIETFTEQFSRILVYFGEEMILEDEIFQDAYPFFKTLGFGAESFPVLVDKIVANDAPILNAIASAIYSSNADANTLISDLIGSFLSEDGILQLVDVFEYASNVITPEEFASMASLFASLFVESANPDLGEDVDFMLHFALFDLMGSSNRVFESFDEIEALFADDAEMAQLFEQYVSPDKDGMLSSAGATYQLLVSNDAMYIASKLLDAIADITGGDGESLVEIAAFADSIVQALLSGDFAAMFEGTLEGATFNDMTDNINKLGDIFERVNAYFADDAMLIQAATDLCKGLIGAWNISGSDTLSSAHLFVPAAFAADKALVDLMQNITTSQIAAIFLDLDAMLKSDAEEKSVNEGKFIVRVMQTIAPSYNALSADDKSAIDDAAVVFKAIGLDLSGIVSLMKEVAGTESFTDEAYAAVAERFFGYIINTATRQPLTVNQNSTVFVPVGASEDALVAAAKEVLSVYLDMENGSMEVTDLENYAWSFNSSTEGFFEATLTIDGHSAAIDCYAYDATSPGKVKIFADRYSLIGLLVMQDTALEDYDFASVASTVSQWLPTTLIHEDGSYIDISSDVNTFAVYGFDTTNEPGLYAAIGSLDHEAFGTIEFPIVYRVLASPIESAENITEVHYDIPEIIPQTAQEIYASADVTYGYGMSSQSLPITLGDIDGLDLTALGEQEITVEVEGLAPYRTSIEVVTEEVARYVESAYFEISGEAVFVQNSDYRDTIEFWLSLGCAYSPYDVYEHVGYDDLLALLEAFDITLDITGVDTSVCTKSAFADATLTRADGSVLTQYSFEYKVYSPQADPAEVLDINSYPSYVFAQKDIASAKAFMDRWADARGGLDFTMTDGTTIDYADHADELAASATLEVTVNDHISSSDPYVTYYDAVFTLGYYSFEGNIEVIPDWYATQPTSLDVSPVSGSFVQNSVVDTRHFRASVSFGNGYSHAEIDMQAEANNFIVKADTSMLGYTTVEVTYQGSISSQFDVQIIPLEQAVVVSDTTKQLMVWSEYFSYGLPVGFDVDVTLDSTYFPVFELEHLPVHSYNQSVTELNEYLDSCIYFDELYVELADVDTSTAGLKSAELRLVGKVGSDTAYDVIATMHFGIFPNDIETGTVPVQIMFGGDVSGTTYVFDRSAIDDGSYLDQVSVEVATNYDAITDDIQPTSMTLAELQQTYDVKIEVVSMPEISDNWVIEITSEYAFCRIPNIVIIEDVAQ